MRQNHPARGSLALSAPLSRRSLLKAAGAAGASLTGASLLAACGSSGGGGGSGGAATIEFWDMLWGLDRYEPTARALVAEWNRANPDLQVKYRLIPWASFYEVFSTAVASGTTPDVSTGATFQAFQFEQAIEPMNDAVAQWRRDGTYDQVIPASIEAQQTADGVQTGLPWGMTLRTLSYNRKLFGAAGVRQPRTFDELRAAARRLTGGGRYGMGFCGQGALGWQMLLSLMVNNGGGLYDAKCGPALVTDRNREACQLVQDMVRDGSIPKAAVGWDQTDVSAAMTRGDIAMAITEPALFNSLPNGADIDIASPYEGFHGDKGTLLWYLAMWQYRTSEDKPGATEFMNWWLGNEQPLWSRGGTTQLPVRPAFYDEIRSLQDPRYRKVLDEWVPVGKIMSAPCEYALPTLNQVEGQAFMPTLVQDVLSLKPIDESLQTAQDALSQLRA